MAASIRPSQLQVHRAQRTGRDRKSSSAWCTSGRGKGISRPIFRALLGTRSAIFSRCNVLITKLAHNSIVQFLCVDPVLRAVVFQIFLTWECRFFFVRLDEGVADYPHSLCLLSDLKARVQQCLAPHEELRFLFGGCMLQADVCL